MKFFLAFFLSIFLFHTELTTQVNTIDLKTNKHIKSCNSDNANSRDFRFRYGLQSFYLYLANNYCATKTIKFNFIVWQDNNGKRNFDKKWKSSLKCIAHRINKVFSDIPYPTDSINTLCNIGYVKDSKIRFDLHKTVFIKDSMMNAFNCQGHEAYQKALEKYHPELMNEFNIHLVYRMNECCACTGMGDGFSNYASVISLAGGAPETVPNDTNNEWFTSVAGHFAHELGHVFRLMHTYSDHESNPLSKDYLSDVFCVNSFSFTGSNEPGKSNNLMSGPPNTLYISPLQIGRIHRTLTLFPQVRKYACGYSPFPLKIEKNETWDFSFKSYNDIVIKKGATLRLTCEILMVPESKIIIEPGGKLELVGGKVIAAKECGDTWKGIYINNSKINPNELIFNSNNSINEISIDSNSSILDIN